MFIINKNSDVIPFEGEHVKKSIASAARAVYGGDLDGKIDVGAVAEDAIRRVTALGLEKVDIEKVQDAVETSLMENRQYAVAKAYILYRERRANERETKNDLISYTEVMNGYLDKTDWRQKENSNVNYSIGGSILHNNSSITANYWLKRVYSPKIAEAHKNAELHLHDLGMFEPYCCGHSLRELILRGITGVADKVSSGPAKHLGTLCQQIVNFLGILQNEWAGAQAFSSVDTYLAPFIKKDAMTYKEVYQCCQTLLYGINTPSRWGSQAPFSNFTHDWTVPEDMKDRKAIVWGKEEDFTYGDCQAEMDMFNKAFFTLFTEGDNQGRSFQYPIPTINITKDFWDQNPENQEILFKLTSKFGTPYFQNFISSDMDPSDVRSMCCRLRLDKRELRKRGGGLFGSAELTGSVGVVTLNLPRIGYLANDETEFYSRLDDLMDVARDSLEIKRKVLTKNLSEGLYPYTKAYISSFDNFFSTIGLVGMNEACRNLFGSEVHIGTERGKKFAVEVLNHMRDRIANYQVETGNLYNLESTPAESTCYRLALHDKKKYPDIITAGTEDPYYTNSSNLPVGYSDDPWEVISHQEGIQTLYTGGTVLHAFLGQQIEDPDATKHFIRKVFENSKIPYLTISPVYSICSVHGYLPGKQERCPKCRDEQVKAYKKKLTELKKRKAELEVIG